MSAVALFENRTQTTNRGERKRVKMIKIAIIVISENIPLLETSENAKLLNSMLETNFISDIIKNLKLFLTDQVWDRPS
jgi:hypothetical protein